MQGKGRKTPGGSPTKHPNPATPQRGRAPTERAARAGDAESEGEALLKVLSASVYSCFALPLGRFTGLAFGVTFNVSFPPAHGNV